jgi:hypothetical protein
MSESLKVLTYRIIPFDIGNEIIGEKRDDLISFLNSKQLNGISSPITEPINFEIDPTENINISISVFRDGIGLISIREEPIQYNNIKEFNHIEIIKKRKECHRQILKHTHIITPQINEIIAALRSFCDTDIRHTALSNWEHNGLSYVMSFYFIQGNPVCMKSPLFQDKLLTLLFPHDYGQQIQYDLKSLRIDKKIIEQKFRNNYGNIIKNDCESLPHIYAYASWSNFVVIGNISEQNILDYYEIEKDLQHIWFYTYITDKFIENSLSQLDYKVPENKLAKLYAVLTEMLYKINKYEGVISSNFHEKDFKLYETLKKSSRLNLLIDSVERRASLLKDRYAWIIEEKRIHLDKKIELILFIIAVLSLISSFDTYIGLDTEKIIWLIISIIIFALLLFRHYIFNSNNK